MGWSEKYKKSINCDNPKGFSQRAHCQGRKKKMNEAKEKQDHEVSMAKTQVKKSIDNLQKVAKVLAKKTDADNLPAWVQAKLTDTEHNTDAAASYMTGKEDLDEGKKKCGEGKYWCKTDEKCKKIPSGHHVMPNGDLMKDSEHEESGDVSEGKRDGKSAKDKDYSLRDWFKGGGWVQAGGKYDGKPCAKQPGQKTKPFCRDADDRAAMSKEERNKRAKKKRKEDPNPNRKGKAKMVREQVKLLDGESGAAALRRLFKTNPRLAGKVGGKPEDVLELPSDSKLKLAQHYEPEGEVVSEKKDACYKKVKARYDVWPSAYASGALVKCRKVGAANWGNKTKKESYEYSNWRDDFKALEIETVDLIKAEPLIGEGAQYQPGDKIPPSAMIPKEKPTGAARYKFGVDKTGLKGPEKPLNLEAKDPCWDGYKQVGMKKKGGKMVPNCVKEEYSNWRKELAEGAAWTRKEGQNKKGGLNEKGRKSYERENPGSDLKAPSKKVGNKRRASFCARMKGMKKKLTSKKTANDPDSRINKSLRAWNC